MSNSRPFDLSKFTNLITDFREKRESQQQFLGDRRGDVYVFTTALELAVNVALVTGRPLLLTGPPGAGKSTFARNVARVLGWRYYQEVITSQTRAQELLYKVDLLKRLYDANASRQASQPATVSDEDSASTPSQTRDVDEWRRYVTPGILWWAFDAASAATGGLLESPDVRFRHLDPARNQVRVAADVPAGAHNAPGRAVLLLDEIDKADPDFPSSLLEPLGRLEFSVSELQYTVSAAPGQAPLIIVTSNGERNLSDAFVRRCIVIELKVLDSTQRIELAKVHFGEAHEGLYSDVSLQIDTLALSRELRAPSTAEFLDAVEVGVHWELEAGSPELKQVVDAVLKKPKDLQTGLRR